MRKSKRFLRTTFLGGIVTLLPLAVIIIIGTWIYGFVARLIDPLAGVLASNTTVSGFLATLIVLAGILVLFFLLGLLIRTRFGRLSWRGMEKQLLGRIPLYNFSRTAIEQFTNRENSPFRRVAFAQPFGNETMLLGFVTEEFANGDKMVFIPTAPNPTGGNIYRLKPEYVQVVDAPVEVAMNAIVSCGAGAAKIDTASGNSSISR